MQIVIEIPEERYKDIKRIAEVQLDRRTDTVEQIIANGVPLPKGHGRLIDADVLLRKHPEFDTYPFPSTTIITAPPIIEADSEGEFRKRGIK